MAERVDLAQAAAEAKRGSEAAALPPCDLVMKGGITSGVVYPGAVLRLAASYRLQRVGGSSAGAIAAGISAAAEYGRQRSRRQDGMVDLEQVTRQLAEEPDFLLNLFQPTPASRQAFELGLLASSTPGGKLAKADQVMAAALRRRPWIAMVLAVLVAGVIALCATWLGAGLSVPVILLTLVVTLVLVAVLVACAIGLAVGLSLLRGVQALSRSNQGFCPGRRQSGYDQDALIEWLDDAIQRCAGLPQRDEGHVLTVGALKEAGVELCTTTTDLTSGRLAVVPRNIDEYSFQPKQWRRLFPDHIVVHLVRAASGNARGEVDLDDEATYRLPCDELPVLVAVRVSLSFPVLMSTVPVYVAHDGGTDHPHVLSDGGITSNFPIHFFDTWFPVDPTFGLDLVADAEGTAEAVAMLSQQPATRWHVSEKTAGLFAQIKDAMQNWRDNMQSELPGFSDRVCQIRLQRGEGGLNLRMRLDAIADLMQRGYQAGDELVEAFPPYDQRSWTAHRLTRFKLLMEKEQEGLHEVAINAADFLDELAAGRDDYPIADQAVAAASILLAVAGTWGPPPASPNFCDAPTAQAVMRIVPRA